MPRAAAKRLDNVTCHLVPLSTGLHSVCHRPVLEDDRGLVGVKSHGHGLCARRPGDGADGSGSC